MSLKITKLFVEYQEQPLGLDEAVPRFSWLLTSTKQNVLQIACRIQVFNHGCRRHWTPRTNVCGIRENSIPAYPQAFPTAGPRLSPALPIR